MALADIDDLEAVLDRALTPEESARAELLLEEASDLVVGYLMWSSIPDEVPGAVVRVVAQIAATALTAPKAAYPEGSSVSAGPYSIKMGGDSSNVYLTNGLKMRLKPYRRAMNSIPLASDRYAL
ncbi:head-to-tail adaptor [Mycobacterium phage Mozy]|uniref:Head-to-tail adaptor n=1 Tax=Mycobacterium phage Mozy TaxID=2922213 RepID=G1D4C2_9CAUD|nr:head-tail adaptor Ad1 [Mycobacterium phage Mozy]AEK09622.1 head-to-tail adaptor [Mycobacterium phage Mozy]